MKPRDPARALYDLKCEIAYRVGVDRECVEVRTVWWRWLAANGTETMDLTEKAAVALARIRGRVEAYMKRRERFNGTGSTVTALAEGK